MYECGLPMEGSGVVIKFLSKILIKHREDLKPRSPYWRMGSIRGSGKGFRHGA